MNLSLFDRTATQAEQILQAIQQKPGVTNWELVQLSLKYSSRISELRRDGYDIRAKRVYMNGKATGVFRYYLGEPDERN